MVTAQAGGPFAKRRVSRMARLRMAEDLLALCRPRSALSSYIHQEQGGKRVNLHSLFNPPFIFTFPLFLLSILQPVGYPMKSILFNFALFSHQAQVEINSIDTYRENAQKK